MVEWKIPKYTEFVILLVAASLGLLFNYLQFFTQTSILLGYILLLIIALSFFELRKYQELEEKILKYNSRIGRIGARWEWNNDGTLFIGNTRNVTLRTRTIQTLIDSLKDCPDFSEKFRKASFDVGVSFSEDLKGELTEKRRFRYDSNIKEKIDLWIQFDSDTGMGEFSIDDKKISGTDLPCSIKVRNSFIASDKISSTNECIFFEGYFEGIFQKFIQVNVNVRETNCSAKGADCCIFEVRLKA